MNFHNNKHKHSSLHCAVKINHGFYLNQNQKIFRWHARKLHIQDLSFSRSTLLSSLASLFLPYTFSPLYTILLQPLQLGLLFLLFQVTLLSLPLFILSYMHFNQVGWIKILSFFVSCWFCHKWEYPFWNLICIVVRP